jgi:hypothetical protein
MNSLNSRWLLLGSAALIVLTQIACTAWLGRQVEAYSPVDPSSGLADITEQLASVKSAVSDVQDTADAIQARTGALTESMSSVARACSYR